MIIRSLLDTDLYKLTMQQVVLHKFPDVNVEYEFRLRNLKPGILVTFRDEIEKEIKSLCSLRFHNGELDYLRTLPFISEGYLEFLRCFNLNDKFIDVFEADGRLQIRIKGTWLNTILFETPVLAIVSEIYSTTALRQDKLYERLYQKIESIKKYDRPFIFVDFGTRRRYSRQWQENMVYTLSDALPKNFIGTSNVYLAKMFNLKPIGTMAHEYIQAMQALVRLQDSQKYAFQKWAEEYRGRLGIALSDTLGMNAFFRDFDLYFAKLFDGARHDSGDPYIWARKLIKHYEALGIDPRTKTAVFSDGLNPERAMALNDAFSSRIKCSFGIGTNLTNDTGFTAPQIVIKMTKCDGRPVAKISDSKGKQMCNDKEYLKYLASVFRIQRKDLFQ